MAASCALPGAQLPKNCWGCKLTFGFILPPVKQPYIELMLIFRGMGAIATTPIYIRVIPMRTRSFLEPILLNTVLKEDDSHMQHGDRHAPQRSDTVQREIRFSQSKVKNLF